MLARKSSQRFSGKRRREKKHLNTSIGIQNYPFQNVLSTNMNLISGNINMLYIVGRCNKKILYINEIIKTGRGQSLKKL